ncbi:hypothetical protein H7X68_01500 [Candidatus Saccharibacteria bacterium]|nr:hypothetical protein [Candidatus Saccharibacteria bacterium]
MSNTNSKTSPEEQAVIASLGTSGEKVVAFVHKTVADALSTNAEELRAAVERFNEYVTASEAKESGNTALLTSIRNALNVALGEHAAAATDLNDGKQVSPAAVAKATEATAAVAELELEWKTMVDQTLADHEERINVLENKVKVPTLAPVPAPELTPEPKVVDPKPEPKIVTVEPNKPDEDDQTNVIVPPVQPSVVRYANPKIWGGLAWALAAAGFIVGGIIVLNIWEGFFPGVPAAMQWVRWLTLMLFPVFGLFAGGALGSYIESQQPARETTVA